MGGQGIITLTRLLSEAALIEGFDVKTSELHGLSQRGGSVETHVRIGKEIYSPLVKQAGADLVISLEAQESLRACQYGNSKQTVFLVNDLIKPILTVSKSFSSRAVEAELKKFSKKVILVSASKIAKEKLGNDVLSGIYLLGLAVFKKLIPLKPNSIIQAIEKIIPGKHLEINKKAFELNNN